MPRIQVIKSGYYDTLQDLGRLGMTSFGVPISGVMDVISAKMANALLENSHDCAVLEMTLTGPTLLFQKETIIAISGADMSPKLNEKPVRLQSKININTGDILSFGHAKYGCRCYLAVKNGFKSERILNSLSFYKNVTKTNKLEKGHELYIAPQTHHSQTDNSHIKVDKQIFNTSNLIVSKGSEFDFLTGRQKKFLLSNTFQIALNSRMGYQFKTTSALAHKHEMLTSSVMPGTVQLTQSGKIIALMRDCQTTGGYPRILQITDKSQCVLAQKNTFQKVNFSLK